MTTDPFPNQLAELCRTEPTRAKWVLVPAHAIGHTIGERLALEAGRWARRSREVASAGRAHYATGRARKLEQASCAMRETGSREADQSDVGRSITQHRSTIHHCLAVRPRASLPTVVLCLGTTAFFNYSPFGSTRRTAPPGRRPSRMMAS
jgi:hypothetical protein